MSAVAGGYRAGTHGRAGRGGGGGMGMLFSLSRQQQSRLALSVPVTALITWYMVRPFGTASQAAVDPQSFVGSWVPEGHRPYELVKTTRISPDSRVLRFALPAAMPTLGLPLPSCLKVKHTFPNPEPNDEFPGETFTLDKSYSPISVPGAKGHFDLLVKGYPYRTGGGLGHYLVDMKVGEVAQMKAKAPRIMHGDVYHPNRWAKLGFVAGGTGIAPHLQMIRAILADPDDTTELSLVFASRREEDILMRSELESYARSGRVAVRHVLSQPPKGGWAGEKKSNPHVLLRSGRVSVADMRAGLPAPGAGMMILVCGKDGFVESVGGMTVRAPPKPGEKKGPKVQGPLKGLLKAAGYTADMVYKF